MMLRPPSWPARLCSGFLALLLAVMQILLVAHAAQHRGDPHSEDHATLHSTCGHDHGEADCSLCRLIAQTSADAPPPAVRLPAFGSSLALPSLPSPGHPRVVMFWICTGPRGPPALA